MVLVAYTVCFVPERAYVSTGREGVGEVAMDPRVRQQGVFKTRRT